MTSVVTLSLQWGTIRDPTLPPNPYNHVVECISGWSMKVNGMRPPERDVFRATFKSVPMLETVSSGKGKRCNIHITAKQQPEFDPKTGTSMSEPPLEFITECLDCLANMGYKVTASHSVVGTDNLAISVWTMQHHVAKKS